MTKLYFTKLVAIAFSLSLLMQVGGCELPVEEPEPDDFSDTSSSNSSSSSASSTSSSSTSSSGSVDFIKDGAPFAFRIIDLQNRSVRFLRNGDTVDLSQLPSPFNIEVLTEDIYKSVAVSMFSNDYSLARTEEEPAWTYAASGEGFDGPAGDYTIKAVGFTGDRKSGLASHDNIIYVTFTGEHPSSPALPSTSSSGGSTSSSGGSSPTEAKDFVFQIIDASHRVLKVLSYGETLDLNTLPPIFNIQAATESNFASVAVNIIGNNYALERVEETPIWTLTSELEGFLGPAGAYLLEATGYSEDGANGIATPKQRMLVKFIGDAKQKQNSQSPFSFIIFDELGQSVAEITEGSRFDVQELPWPFFIEAKTSQSFNSVILLASSEDFYIERLEEEPTWTVTADGRTFTRNPGTYTLSATGYSLDNAQGVASTTSTVSFALERVYETTEQPNRRPDVINEAVETPYNTPINGLDVLSNDVDVDGDPLTLIGASIDNGGQVTVIDNRLTITPDNGYVGSLTVTYHVSDGQLTSDGELTVVVLDSSYTMDISWAPPRFRESGAPLLSGDIYGYEIVYRRQGSSNSFMKFVLGGQSNATRLDNLSPDIYDITITTLDKQGLYSAPSQKLSAQP